MASNWYDSDRIKDVIVVGLSSAIFLSLYVLVYPRFAAIGTDGVSYALLAKNILEGNGFQVFGTTFTYFSPLTSFAIVPFYLLIGNIEVAAHVAMAVCSLLAMLFCYFAARSIFGRTSAMATVILLSFVSVWMWTGTRVVAQPLAAALSTALLFPLIRALPGNARSFREMISCAAFAGMIGGLLYLNRPEYIFVIAPIALFFFWAGYSRFSRARNAVLVLVSILLFFSTIAPYLLFLRGELGEWTVTGRLREQYQITMDQLDRPLTLVDAPELSGNPVTLYVKSLISPTFYETYFEFLIAVEQNIFSTLHFIGIALFGVGFFAAIKQKLIGKFMPILVPLSIIFALALGHTGERGYLQPYIPLLMIVIGFGFVSVTRMIADTYELSGRVRFLPGFVIGLLCIASFSFTTFQNYFFRPQSTWKAGEYQLIADWMNANISNLSERKIAARKPEIPFYVGSGGWMEITGEEEPRDLVDMMAKNGTEYLVLDTRALGEKLSGLVEKDGAFRSSGLGLLYEIQYYDQRILLYRLLNDL
jgi:4-amino-4-deoxy-L-arabinose transferase-like glycosyltransferase